MKKLLVMLAALLCLAALAFAEDSLTLYDRFTVSRNTETLDLGELKIVNLDRLRGYLDQLPKLNHLNAPGLRVSVKDLEALYADYPGLRIVCQFPLVKKSISTEQTAYSTMNTPEDQRVGEKRFEAIKYAPTLRAVDLGHNAIRDLTFLTALPELRVLIVADNHIKDLSPLAQLPKLEYLELFMNEFTDLTPLSGLTNLLDLNICRNKITDVTPLLGLTQLERLWLPDNFLTEEQKAELEAALPNTHIVYEWSRSTSFGWRHHPRYDVIRRIFPSGIYEPFPKTQP